MLVSELLSCRWIWQRPKWPAFCWDAAGLLPALSKARRTQGELAGVARLLNSTLDLSAQLEVLTLDGLNTSTIARSARPGNARFWTDYCARGSHKTSASLVNSVLQSARFWIRHAETGLNERQRKALTWMLNAIESHFGSLVTRTR